MYPVNTTLHGEILKKATISVHFGVAFEYRVVIGLEKLSNVFKLFSPQTKTRGR